MVCFSIMRGTRRGDSWPNVESKTSSSDAYDNGDPFQTLRSGSALIDCGRHRPIPAQSRVTFCEAHCPKSYSPFRLHEACRTKSCADFVKHVAQSRIRVLKHFVLSCVRPRSVYRGIHFAKHVAQDPI